MGVWECGSVGVATPDVIFADVAAVEQNFSRVDVVKSLNEENDGALAAAAGTHQRHALLRLDNKIEIVQNKSLRPRRVGKSNIFELNTALKRRGAVAAWYETFVGVDVDGGRALDDFDYFEGGSLRAGYCAKVWGRAADEECTG